MPNRTALFQIAAFLLTAGAAVIALQQSSWIPTYDSELKLFGAITIAAGLLFVAFAFARSAQPLLDSAIFYFRGRVTYVREIAEIPDLDLLFTHYEKIFGADLIPQHEFTKWIVKNPTICHKVSRVKSHNQQSKSTIAGFFDFEPLTSHAQKRLLNGVIEGWGLSAKDILSPKTTRQPKCYYIGSVGTTSNSQGDRAATLLCALEHVKKLNSSRPITLLTNPVTADGLRLCTDFGFVPINEDRPKGVWVLDLPLAAAVPRYERKVLKALIRDA